MKCLYSSRYKSFGKCMLEMTPFPIIPRPTEQDCQIFSNVNPSCRVLSEHIYSSHFTFISSLYIEPVKYARNEHIRGPLNLKMAYNQSRDSLFTNTTVPRRNPIRFRRIFYFPCPMQHQYKMANQVISSVPSKCQRKIRTTKLFYPCEARYHF